MITKRPLRLPQWKRDARVFAVAAAYGAFAVVAGVAAMPLTGPTSRTETAVVQEPAKTVWDGVYTEGQAQRGQNTYKRSCGPCHMDDLSGDEGPALGGAIFFARWRDHTVAEMLLTIAKRMPKNMPGSLSPQEYIDIASFLLRANQIPAGSAELPLDLQALDQIFITEKAPQK